MRETNLAGIGALLVGVAALYFGRPVLMPLAVALLIAFAVTPLCEWLERRRLGRVTSVIAVTFAIAGFAGGLGWVVAREAGKLAEDVPRYRTILKEKVRDLREPIGSLSGAAEEISELGAAIDPAAVAAPTAKVEVVEKRLLGALGDVFAPLLGPLGTAAIIAVLALFILLEREELRDRLIWLTGARDLSLTTHALDDAGRRVTRYLAMQSLVCGVHGVAVGVGLWAIGIPGAALWGALSALLRFLPYFGPWIAAALPILVSIAAFHGWSVPLLTIGLFVVLELVSNNVLEPWLYGSSAGMSPFGVVFSAVFWTWLWGIPGLLVATPLTVCLVVAGRYVHDLRFFSVLLGDEPALPPDVRLYQRLVALDLDEAERVLGQACAGTTLEATTDAVVLPVLRRLAADDQRGAWEPERAGELRVRFEELLGEIADAAPAREQLAAGVRIAFAPALDETDALASRWIARLCEGHGAAASVASPHALASEIAEDVEKQAPHVVCVSALSPRAAAHARLVCKRIERTQGAADVRVGCWAAPPHECDARPLPAGAIAITSVAELLAALQSHRARVGVVVADAGEVGR
jgi:predicted PurR-regulated permease PerM